MSAMTRWEYVKRVLMPCALVLWAMKERGIALDPERVRAHRERLLAEKARIGQALVADQLVAAALGEREGAAQRELAALEAARASEALRLNADRARWESAREAIREMRTDKARGPTIKSLGPAPKLVRKSAFTADIAKARTRLERASAFNAGSAQQKAWLLYDRLKLPPQFKQGADGRRVTTDRKALEALLRARSTAPAARTILQLLIDYEHTDQILGTFIEPCFELAPNGTERVKARIHSSYGLHRTGSGRIASGNDNDEKASHSDSNAQNQPKEIRDCYVPSPGMCFVQVDWDKLEWLLSLHFAGDDAGFKRAVRQPDGSPGEDQHRRLAAALFKIAYEDVSQSQRQLSKKGTHGINYGMGARKLAAELGISVKEASEIISAYKAAFPLVAAWREEVIALATKQHYLDTPFGWRRWLWQNEPPKMLSQLPQGTGGDMIKIVLPDVARIFCSFGGFLLNTSHDSVLGEVPIEHGPAALTAVIATFERTWRTLGGRSFSASGKSGPNWLAVS